MGKVDFKKTLRHLYGARAGEPVLVEVPAMNFAMVDGTGDPNDSVEFQQAMAVLYPVSYTLKFMLKPTGFEYVVPPPEGLWWADSMEDFARLDKSEWKWTMMIMQPEPVTLDRFDHAVATVREKKDPPGLARLRLETYDEGLSAQVLHVGPYADEGPTIEKLHAFIDAQGCRRRGKHHEIYLGDPRRSAPEKLKTIIRQSVERL
jgi:hypothetical protein